MAKHQVFASSEYQEEEFDYLSLLTEETRRSLQEFYDRTDNRMRRQAKPKKVKD